MQLIPVMVFVLVSTFAATPLRAAEKIRVAYQAVAPESTPSWVTAEKGIWRQYGFETEQA